MKKLSEAELHWKLYILLFAAVTDALISLERCNYGTAAAILTAAQKKAEELLLSEGEVAK